LLTIANGDQEVPPITAIDIIRICQRKLHIDREKTPSFSSRVEHLASIALANTIDLVPVNTKDD